MANTKVTENVIKDSAVVTAGIADDAVTTAKIPDSAITTAKIADNSVTTAKIPDDGVTTAKIADNQVTLAKMAGLARGKIIYGDSSGNPAALAVGSAGTVLTSDGTDISWAEEVATNYLPLAGGTMTGNIAHASNFTLDVGGDIELNADGGDINFKDGSDFIGKFKNSSNNFVVKSVYQDADLLIQGNDGGSDVTALTFDMSVGGQLLAAPLGVSVPSYSFAGDSNTGMTRPTGDTLQFVTGGTERVRINSTGVVVSGDITKGSGEFKIKNTANGENVGIYTTSSSSELHALKIHSGGNVEVLNGNLVVGNASGATITMNDTDTSQEDFAFVLGANALAMRKTSNSNDIMRLDLTNERVGIGTTSPSAKLDVKDTINITNSGNVSLQAIKATAFGYDAGYRVVQIGSEVANTSSNLSFGVDLSSNSSGSFSGSGNDIFFRNGVLFKTPNSANNGFHNYITMDDGEVIFSGKTRVLTASPTILELETTNSSSYKFYIENRYDASNTVNFVWNTTTLMRFTSNYNALALMPGNDPGVAIGTYDDDGHKLNIYRGSSGDCSVNIKASGGGDATLIMDNGAANRDNIIRFKEQGTQVGQITYVCNGDYLKFSAGSNNNSSKFIVYGTGDCVADRRLGLTGVSASGDIAIQTGTGTSGDTWRFGGHVSNTTSYWINDDNDGVYMTYGSSTWQTHSDERIKENITSLGTVLPDLVNMRCVKYNRKGKSDDKIGFIAQDWQSKFPEVVDEDDGFMVESDGSIVAKADTESTDKVKSVAYTETIPILLKAIQELEARIATLESS